MKIEVRNDKVVIDGYVNAVGRDSRPISSPMGKFVEQVEPGAFRGSLEKRKNVELLLNHRKDRRLGSTAGGEITLAEDNIGLRAHAEITDSEVIEKARSGRLRGWSFGMYAGNSEFEERAGNIPRRHIRELDLFEVSLIDDTMLPCYAGTSVECRADGDIISETRSFEDTPVFDVTLLEKQLSEIRAEIEIADAEYILWKLKNEYGENVSEFRYNHNHDPTTGKFTSGNSFKGLTTGKKSVKLDSKGIPYRYPELRLPKKEYGKVIHEINTMYHAKYSGKEKGILILNKSTYLFEIHDFDEYNIYFKEKD